MPEHTPIDLAAWVGEAPAGREEFRQAVHLILTAITGHPLLRKTMVMKGGILMALRYQSTRFTTDIDFSTSLLPAELDGENVRDALAEGLALVTADSEYGLDCRIQRYRVNPPAPGASFPSIEMTIGYAAKGSAKHRRLLNNQSPDKVSIDFSLNERILHLEDLEIGTGDPLLVYASADLIAEKFRSLLQQVPRNRFRRQDIFDLRLLLQREITPEEKQTILCVLREKAHSREIEPDAESLANEEVKRRAAHDYPTLAAEIEGELPDFEIAYEEVAAFYRSLPWDEDTAILLADG